ncbi:aspartyl-phosphate phosphatase Spo0E family protein [Alicyclobacillaceae bacterium I2511]|nr:aspartyl-phosphate phosphatase Spo0E family protein [Alicyclobacillaceae bacterium I2511]
MNVQHPSLRVEKLRQHLYQTVSECAGNLAHPQVIAASEALDEAILQDMRQSTVRPHSPTHLTEIGVSAAIAVG